MIPLLSSSQMRALDAHAIDTIGIPGLVLMENAARAVLDVIEERLGDVQFLTCAVVCGPGNNGGDGFAVARHLHLRGADVDVFVLCDEKQIKGDARTNFILLDKLEVLMVRWEDAQGDVSLADYDVVVDAVFGTGKPRAAEGAYAAAVAAINDADGLVVAVDVPSGVDASTGETAGPVVDADVTVTFQCAKIGHMLPPGCDYIGDLIVSPISIPEREEVFSQVQFALPENEDVLDALPPRPRDAHKGDFGNLLVIAGSRGMSGAARLVSLAALRSGVGLVKVAVPESVRAEVAAHRAEIMTIGLPETEAGTISAAALETFKPYLAWADVVAVGPGLGQHADTAKFLQALFHDRELPFVIDADALNLIAAYNLLGDLPKDCILTPHPGEFDRLCNATVGAQPAVPGVRPESVFFTRAVAAQTFAREHKLCVVLKGAPTICYDAQGFGIVNPTGNPGLATAGSGDVLTGVIAALRAQGLHAHVAGWAGAFLHGRAADLAVEEIGMASLVAGDVIEYLPEAFQSLVERDEDDDDSCSCGGECTCGGDA
jgi:ADP-dependent NAD(P)H-hydrate dehydratase / NAD(P)H-hydrate epimerase